MLEEAGQLATGFAMHENGLFGLAGFTQLSQPAGYFRNCLVPGDRFPFAGLYREPSASPATGSMASHHVEQQEIVSQALAP